MVRYLKTLFKAQSPDVLNENTVGIGIYARTNESTVTLSNNIREKIEEVVEHYQTV